MIRSKVIVNESFQVHVLNRVLYIEDVDGDDLMSIDANDAPDLVKAIQMVLDELPVNTGSSEPKQKS